MDIINDSNKQKMHTHAYVHKETQRTADSTEVSLDDRCISGGGVHLFVRFVRFLAETTIVRFEVNECRAKERHKEKKCCYSFTMIV